MSDTPACPFACHGGEKMLYDVRMGPVAVLRDNVIHVAYQANPGGPPAHPHVVTYNVASKTWSAPVRIGEAPHYDHHFAPVLWFDNDGRLHALFNCHGKSGTHIVAAEPGSIERWTEGPRIAQSISYPHVLPMAGGKLLLYCRTWGHMGYWGYQISGDGGFSWSAPRTLVDMDRDPQDGNDCWAGSYHSVCPAPDGHSLHVAFVYLDEQKRLNPLYNRRFTTRRTVNRYHLYYMRLDAATGQIYSVDGDRMDPPVNRQQAERCKVWDTGWRLTNMPSIWIGEQDEPSFLMPVSGKSPWECKFYFIRRRGRSWEQIPVAETNSAWCGCLLRGEKENALAAYVVSGKDYGELLDYGGGGLEQWISHDGGAAWTLSRTLNPEPGLLYNNPRHVERSTGGPVEDYLLFFGWKGPGSLHQGAARHSPTANRGKAFLWRNGEWL